MKNGPLIGKIAAIVNAAVLVTLFVGCPARDRQDIMFQSIATEPPPPIDLHFTTISPPNHGFQKLVPADDGNPPTSQEVKDNNKPAK